MTPVCRAKSLGETIPADIVELQVQPCQNPSACGLICVVCSFRMETHLLHSLLCLVSKSCPAHSRTSVNVCWVCGRCRPQTRMIQAVMKHDKVSPVRSQLPAPPSPPVLPHVVRSCVVSHSPPLVLAHWAPEARDVSSNGR